MIGRRLLARASPTVAIDNKKFHNPATKGELAGAVIETVIALRAVMEALEALQHGRSPAEYIPIVDRQLDTLNKVFDRLTGWTPDR
jgi:hypothetical protein